MLPLLLAGQAMAAMDTAIVNVAAPALHEDLGISGALLQMVVAGYILAYAVFLITGARLGDDHGYRRLFIIGTALFTAASLACGLAPDTMFLVVARVIQGLGAALMVPQVLSLIQRQYEGQAKVRAIGFYSMILGLGAACGQLLGGIIITVDLFGLSWRPAFLLNVPIGLLLLAYAPRHLPAVRGLAPRQLDLVGVLLLSVSMLLMIVPLTFGNELGWGSWVALCLGAGALGLFGFVRYEQQLVRRGGAPLLDFKAIFAPGIRAGLSGVAIGFIGYGGWLFALALYLQDGLQLSAMTSGMVFTAYAGGFGSANLTWSRLPAPLLRWAPTTALLTLAASSLGFGACAYTAGWLPFAMVPLLLVTGACHGLSFGTLVNQMSLRVVPAQAPALSGLVSTSVQLSIVIGIATLGTLYLGLERVVGARNAISAVALAISCAALLAAHCAVRLARAPLPPRP
ncbi:MFS transporter [Oxalobacteraceae bacterium]|nr:MFS transporter [Oxalobacteraceae bacterium]